MVMMASPEIPTDLCILESGVAMAAVPIKEAAKPIKMSRPISMSLESFSHNPNSDVDSNAPVWLCMSA